MALLANGVLLGLIASLIRLASATDYCRDVQCMKGMHTMCNYPDETPGGECRSLTGQGLNSKQIEDLLHVHNRFREYVAAGKETRTLGGPLPQAANMGVMTWDEEIARIAQRWALQCHFGHDQCRALPNMKVGQNVAIAGSTAQGPPNITKLAVMWYEKEVGLYNAGGVSSYQFSMGYGHFTQWIWATSYKLGCGYTGFQSGIMNQNYLVCNYGPSGNVMRWPMYQQGRPCSGCPEGTTCGGDSRYPSLCAAEGSEVPRGDGSAGPGFAEGEVGGGANAASGPRYSALLTVLISALAASAALLSLL